jgi:predicted ThiF/HesA family dinucleotide-utilizing enzyme
MFIQTGQATSVEIAYPAPSPSTALAAKRAKRLDTISEPGVIYIGEAAVNAVDYEDVWVLSKWTGTALLYCQVPAAWTDHLTVAYGVS